MHFQEFVLKTALNYHVFVTQRPRYIDNDGVFDLRKKKHVIIV